MWPNDFPEWWDWAYPQGYRLVYRYLRRRGLRHARAADLAEEATQEAARRAAERIGSPGYFASRENFCGWLVTVARNHARDMLAHERIGQLPPGPDPPQPPSSHEAVASVWQCFQQLPLLDQRILDLYYWDRLTHEQIALIIIDPAPAAPEPLGQRCRRLRLKALARLRVILLRSGIDPVDWNLDAPSWRR
jgi:RNA polymerase sigma factor (sigma-70 family)